MSETSLLLMADIQLAEGIDNPISPESLQNVINIAFVSGLQQRETELSLSNEYECVIRLVAEAESQQLNLEFRGMHKPTNVLSFCYEDLENYLGDIVICLPVVEREALEQRKTILAHFQHIVVHGILHLLGYDHVDDQDAKEMEALEQEILAQFGIDNPYQPH